MAEAGAGALVLDRVTRTFGKRAVVDDVSFDAPTGQVTVLVGPSGCGKTTLLRLIAGIDRPSAGRILVEGREVASATTFLLPERRRIGLMFQDYALFPHLTVLENVAFGLGGVPRAARRTIAADAIALVGLSHLADRRPSLLSGGEQQRLALARALAPSPRALLMDEPFSNLDRGLREDVRAGTLAILHQAGITTIVVTHDPEEALAIGDHLVLLDQGRVIQAGPAASLYARPTGLAAARALSDLNIVPGRLEGDIMRTALGPVEVRPSDGMEGDVEGIACFRPEHLALGPPGSGLPGRIEKRTFRGATTWLSVAVAGLAGPLRISVSSDRVPPHDEVGVIVEPRAAMVFPLDENRLSKTNPSSQH